MTPSYGAVLVDQPIDRDQFEVAGAVISSKGTGRIASCDDPRFAVLSHPIESYILEGLGYRWEDLLWQGRYIAVTNVLCRRCGTIYPRRRLAAPGGFGCTTMLWAGVASGLAAGLWKRSLPFGLAAGFLAVALAATIFEWIAQRYNRRHFSARDAALRAERACPTCHADDAKAIFRIWISPVMCPSCRVVALRFRIVGKS
jgi:hypothetical protein